MMLQLLLAAVAVLGIVPTASVHLDADADALTSIPDHGPFLSKNYAGYVPVSQDKATQAYYWLIESENDPATDPVVLWLNGGPGCSSLLGLFTENGPYVFRHGGGLSLNPYRWTTNATMMFIESPGGVGFSKMGNVKKWTDDLTATYNYAALKEIFARHPQFKANKFFLSGESYAGHYVPQLAHQILHGDDASLRSRMQGWMAGNPCTGDIGCNAPDPTYAPFMRYHGFLPTDSRVVQPSMGYLTLDPYDVLVPTCVKKLDMDVTERFETPHLEHLRWKLQGKHVDGLPAPPKPYGPCAQDYLTMWLNKKEVQTAIHVTDPITWSMCGNVPYEFNSSSVVSIYQEVMNKTEWKIMVFSGTADSIVNFIQTEVTVGSMNRTLSNKTMQAWYYPDVYTAGQVQLGGFMVEYDRITWVGVRDAGHMVPQFNPPAAKGLFLGFLANGKPSNQGPTL